MFARRVEDLGLIPNMVHFVKFVLIEKLKTELPPLDIFLTYFCFCHLIFVLPLYMLQSVYSMEYFIII